MTTRRRRRRPQHAVLSLIPATLAALLLAAMLITPPTPTSRPVQVQPTPTATTAPRPPRPAATRTRHLDPPKATFTVVDVTAYCGEHQLMANGHHVPTGGHPHLLVAAGNRWPFGAHLYIRELAATFTITDRIGHGSDLDLYLTPHAEPWEPHLGIGSCNHRARAFGRRHLHITVIRQGGWS